MAKRQRDMISVILICILIFISSTCVSGAQDISGHWAAIGTEASSKIKSMVGNLFDLQKM